jgi:hypothetical protein
MQAKASKNYGRADWVDDLKLALRCAGKDRRPSVLLLTDAQIKEEAWLENISDLLNSGEVLNLFAPDEKAEVTPSWLCCLYQGGSRGGDRNEFFLPFVHVKKLCYV